MKLVAGECVSEEKKVLKVVKSHAVSPKSALTLSYHSSEYEHGSLLNLYRNVLLYCSKEVEHSFYCASL